MRGHDTSKTTNVIRQWRSCHIPMSPAKPLPALEIGSGKAGNPGSVVQRGPEKSLNFREARRERDPR